MNEVKESGKSEKREARKRQRQTALVKQLKHLKNKDYLEGSLAGRCQCPIFVCTTLFFQGHLHTHSLER